MSQKICLPGEYRIPALNVEFDLLDCHEKQGIKVQFDKSSNSLGALGASKG